MICTHNADTVPTLVATKNTTIKIRLSDAEVNDWRAEAKKWGFSLSEWIRAKCNPVPAKQFEVTEVYEDSMTVAPVRKPCKHGLLFCKKCK